MRLAQLARDAEKNCQEEKARWYFAMGGRAISVWHYYIVHRGASAREMTHSPARVASATQTAQTEGNSPSGNQNTSQRYATVQIVSSVLYYAQYLCQNALLYYVVTLSYTQGGMDPWRRKIQRGFPRAKPGVITLFFPSPLILLSFDLVFQVLQLFDITLSTLKTSFARSITNVTRLQPCKAAILGISTVADRP